MSPLLFCFIMSPFQGRRWVGDHVGSGKPLPFIICPFQGRGYARCFIISPFQGRGCLRYAPLWGGGAPVRGLYYRIGACPYLWQVRVTLPL